MMPDALVAVARAGGGLDIDCTPPRLVTPDTMIAIAAAAASSGKRPTIVFRNMPMLLPDVAEKVAAAGEGCVVFVI